MDELVQRLSSGDHEVTVGGPNPSLGEFKERLTDIQHVFIKFTGTDGGTDLGMAVDTSATVLDGADFEKGEGTVHVEGELRLNYVPVRCVADIQLAGMSGSGRLVVLEEEPAL